MRNRIWSALLACLLAVSMVAQPVCAAALSVETDTVEETVLETLAEVSEETEEVPEETEEAPEETEEVPEETEEIPEETEEIPEETEEAPEETEEVFEEELSEEELLDDEAMDAVEEDFSCYTEDANGNKINGFWSEEDETWYLFVPSTMDVADVKIFYTGEISLAYLDGDLEAEVDQEAKSVSGAFTENGGEVVLLATDESLHTVKVMQSKLPSVYIDLADGLNLDTINGGSKDEKYAGNTVYIYDPEDAGNDLSLKKVEVKGRGNSTWALYEKKPYQIKLDKKTSLLGMAKAKKWVLLAGASDDSMLRTRLVYDAAEQMDMDFVTDQKYVDLWIEGDYRGTFLLGEKVEPGDGRLELKNDAGALFEYDEAFYSQEDPADVTYSEMLRRHFVLKEIVEDAQKEAAKADFTQAVDELARYLYSTPVQTITLEELGTLIDVDSFAKYYLINEYALNQESFATSFYWYKDGPEDVLHLGPLWDFDTCMGNDGAVPTGSYGDRNFLFNDLLAIPAFYERTQELYAQYGSLLRGMAEDVDGLYDEILDSATMNYIRWDMLGMSNPKGGPDYCATYDEAVSAVKTWLEGRKTGFQIAKCSSVTGMVNEDGTELLLSYYGSQDSKSMKLSVWSEARGEIDQVTKDAVKGADGAWTCTVDLSLIGVTGFYKMSAYVSDPGKPVATGWTYVDSVKETMLPMGAVVSEDCETMTITLDDGGKYDNMSFSVWSEKDSQDDLDRYPAFRNAEGLWEATVGLARHASAGRYLIHAQTEVDKTHLRVSVCTADVPSVATGPAIRLAFDERYEVLSIKVTGLPEDADAVEVTGYPVKAGAPQDNQRSEASKDSNGVWNAELCMCVFDLEEADIIKIEVVNGEEKAAERYIELPIAVAHRYLNKKDPSCEICGAIRQIVPEMVEAIPMFRLFNADTHEHFFTGSEEERDNLVEIGWKYEGIGWFAPVEIGDPMYRLYNPNTGDHHYTGSVEEREDLKREGWRYEGVAWNTPTDEDMEPLFRLYNPNEQKAGIHHYTSSEEERDNLAEIGWKYEGIGWYGVPAAQVKAPTAPVK